MVFNVFIQHEKQLRDTSSLLMIVINNLPHLYIQNKTFLGSVDPKDYKIKTINDFDMFLLL